MLHIQLLSVSRFGDCMMPNKSFNKYDRYKGHWKEGKMHGFGTYW